MNLNEIRNEYFTRDAIVDMLTRYELYYQIGLGNFILETTQDFDDTVAKLKELNLRVEVDKALTNIIDIILYYGNADDFVDKFEYHLRSRSLIHALKDFINKDTELLNSDDYVEEKTKEIVEDHYFTETMKLQLESDYSFIHDHYDMMITQDVVSKIQGNLK